MAGPPRVLVALDGSPVSEQVLGRAGALARVLTADLLLVRVVVPPPAGYGYIVEPSSGPLAFDPGPELAEAGRYLAKIADRMRRRGHLVGALTAVGMAAEVVARVAGEHGAWAVAMGTHGRGGLERAVLGSVAAQSVGLVSVPLLVARASRDPDDSGQSGAGADPAS
jgi:nucleotide-binding universal stress UspA family protein